jgi:flagellar basal-body rod protein FlgC
MDISSSALHAQRVRAEVVAANMANAETTRSENGSPYQRQSVILRSTGDIGFGGLMNGFASLNSTKEAQGGVEVAGVVTSDALVMRRYDPSHPDADGNGYVSYPDIDPVTEMVDLMGASRSYGLNASALQAEKGMLTASIEILK